MGNISSHQRREDASSHKGRRLPFSTRHIPKYLRPIKSDKQRQRRPSEAGYKSKDSKESKDRAVQFANVKDDSNIERGNRLPNMLLSQTSDESDYDVQHSANFKWIKGRRFTDTRGVEYLFPIDKPELDRQRMQAYVLKWAFGRCGVGAWAIDIALDHPCSEVVGIDICDVFLLHKPAGRRSHSSSYISLPSDPLSSNQKSQSSASNSTSDNTTQSDVANIRFEERNILDGLLYPNDHFDYIHQAHMLFAYTRNQWKQVLDEAIRVLAPGGYIEFLEVEFPGRRYGPKTASAVEQAIKIVSDRGFDAGLAIDLRELLRCAGLTEISGTYISMPLGNWNKEDNYIGNLWRENSEIFLNSAKPWLAPEMSLSSQEYSTLWKECHEEMNETKAFVNVWVAWGRKPTSGQLKTDWDDCNIPGWVDIN
ncbi:hypothetical protein Unana1_00603 [Umbelopsis nana]